MHRSSGCCAKRCENQVDCQKQNLTRAAAAHNCPAANAGVGYHSGVNLLALILIAMALIVVACVFYVAWEFSSGEPGGGNKKEPGESKESKEEQERIQGAFDDHELQRNLALERNKMFEEQLKELAIRSDDPKEAEDAAAYLDLLKTGQLKQQWQQQYKYF